MTKSVLIRNKEYPIRVSYLAIKKVGEKHGGDLSVLNPETMDTKMLETLLYYALVSGCRAEQKELDLQETDMEEALDDCFFAFVQLIPEFFPKQDPTKNAEAQGNP